MITHRHIISGRWLIAANLVIFFMLVLSLTGCFLQQQVGKQQAAETVQVTTNPLGNAIPISASFDGISTEPGSGACGILAFDQRNPTLTENLFKNLGPAILRFGGDSVENVSWSPTGT